MSNIMLLGVQFEELRMKKNEKMRKKGERERTKETELCRVWKVSFFTCNLVVGMLISEREREREREREKEKTVCDVLICHNCELFA